MNKIIFYLLAFSLLTFFGFTISHAQSHREIKNKSRGINKRNAPRYGLASYYAKKFTGRKTANGSSYNSAKLTAACNVIPLGTWVKVTNLKNKTSVIVQINDHLHHKNKRLIDLSKFAAQKLRFITGGVIRVKVDVLGKLKNSGFPGERKLVAL